MNPNWSPWVQYMLRDHAYYYTPDVLLEAEQLPPPARRMRLRRIYEAKKAANRLRRQFGMQPLPPAWEPPEGFFFNLPNPGQEFLFGEEAQEVVRPAFVPRRRPPSRVAFRHPLEEAPVEPTERELFVQPELHPDPELPVRARFYRDYKAWLNYYRILPDNRLLADLEYFHRHPPSSPVSASLHAAVHQALKERGLVGPGGELPQTIYHSRNPGEPSFEEEARRRGLTVEEYLQQLLGVLRQQDQSGQIELFPGGNKAGWTPLDFACPHCGAAKGELCFKPRARGKAYMKKPHSKRRFLASSALSDESMAHEVWQDFRRRARGDE